MQPLNLLRTLLGIPLLLAGLIIVGVALWIVPREAIEAVRVAWELGREWE